MSNNYGSGLIFLLVGLGIGAAVGILFAPQGGEESRDFIADQADKGREYVSRRSRELRDQASDLADRGKEILTEQRAGIDAAVKAGQRAYRANT